ncbi:type II toxin-antitoxin system HicB family antitoxin [Eubacterium callanderi]|uniref:type II toxin-antitoxin system HicB family antitoxin n=1 Tax=Eubacterium callanderi TaxID=53442 RepID=UPI003AB2BB99
MKTIYPVIFTQVKDCVLIEVPDLEILTEGKDMADAIDMARDAIGLKGISLKDDKTDIPAPSNFKDVDPKKGTFANEGESYVSLVDIDFVEYRRKNDNKTVRRNVTLPNWLNQEAESAHLNVSRVLQEALMQKLGVSR